MHRVLPVHAQGQGPGVAVPLQHANTALPVLLVCGAHSLATMYLFGHVLFDSGTERCNSKDSPVPLEVACRQLRRKQGVI